AWNTSWNLACQRKATDWTLVSPIPCREDGSPLSGRVSPRGSWAWPPEMMMRNSPSVASTAAPEAGPSGSSDGGAARSCSRSPQASPLGLERLGARGSQGLEQEANLDLLPSRLFRNERFDRSPYHDEPVAVPRQPPTTLERCLQAQERLAEAADLAESQLGAGHIQVQAVRQQIQHLRSHQDRACRTAAGRWHEENLRVGL
ncbi:unnamed protein product, partial [Polarella glacialis]